MTNLPRLALAACTAAVLMFHGTANAQDKKPNIVVIWGDDIGQSNLSVFTKGVMGYQAPNIDRLAREGMLFTDSYAEQSCTAGRSSFITGQLPFRTGMSKVAMPGSPTLLAAAGEPNIVEKLKAGHTAAGKSYKVHLDGYNFLPYLTGKQENGPREKFYYFSDEGDMLALRYKNWKVHFMVQDQAGTLEI